MSPIKFGQEAQVDCDAALLGVAQWLHVRERCLLSYRSNSPPPVRFSFITRPPTRPHPAVQTIEPSFDRVIPSSSNIRLDEAVQERLRVPWAVLSGGRGGGALTAQERMKKTARPSLFCGGRHIPHAPRETLHGEDHQL